MISQTYHITNIDRETRRRSHGVPITERIDSRIEILGKVPDYERVDLG